MVVALGPLPGRLGTIQYSPITDLNTYCKSVKCAKLGIFNCSMYSQKGVTPWTIGGVSQLVSLSLLMD